MVKKILIVFGTRPEAIKLCPLVKTLKKQPSLFDVRVCVTGQHREMLDQVLSFFDIKPDFDLNIMKHKQDLYDITSRVMLGLRDVLKEFNPSVVVVQGDTTTTFAGSVAAFYHGSAVAHVEAGLRTYDKRAPFPEEVNRQLTTRIADLHFAVTETNKAHLLSENIDQSNIHVVGNTVIDALQLGIAKIEQDQQVSSKILQHIKNVGYDMGRDKQYILVTGHRRESFGLGFKNICKALAEVAKQHPDYDIVYPVHQNPNVKEVVEEGLQGFENIHLIEPLSYSHFIYLMKRSYLILTDSGGVQEEAPSLGKPVLVMRETTERTEAVEAGSVILVGTDVEKIVHHVNKLIQDEAFYTEMQQINNPYGDGHACEYISQVLADYQT